MKRILAWLMILCLLLGAAGCAGRNVPADPTAEPQPTDMPQATDAPAGTDAPAETEAPTEEPKPAVAPGTYRLSVYTVGEISFEKERLADLGIENTCLILNEDHTGTFVLISETIALEWMNDGQLLISGIPYYTMERIDDDTIRLTMGDAVMILTNSEAAELPTDAPAETQAPEEAQAPSAEEPLYPGVPYGNSDGVIDRAALLALYRWLDEMQPGFRYALTFDEISEAAGKQGCDRRNNDGKSHSAYWTDGGKMFVTVTFRNKDGKWSCGAISSSGITDKNDWKKADISGFPRYGSSAPVGSHATNSVVSEIEIGTTKAMLTVTADVPTENWYPIERSGAVRYYSAPSAEKADESQSYILVESKPSVDSINFYREKFEELKTLEPRTIAGVEMQGRSYRYIGMDWIEYYGEIAENVWISIRLTNVDFSAGTETEALVMSLAFAQK